MEDKLTKLILNINGKQFEITPEQEERILNMLANSETEDEIIIEIEETAGIKIKTKEEEENKNEEENKD